MLIMQQAIYRVAHFSFIVALPDDVVADKLLPSLAPFRLEGEPEGPVAFNFYTASSPEPWDDEGEVVEESSSDMGYVRLMHTSQGYRVDLRYTTHSPLHTLHFDEQVTVAIAHVRWDDRWAGESISSMLRLLCSQAVIRQRGVAIHAAAVVVDERAYLFLGRSGTGKSTHAALWLQCFAGCQLLNDDNPFLRVEGTKVIAYGSPWSGKTPCYRNLSYPVAAIVRLQQAPANRFTPLRDLEAFLSLLPSSSAIRTDVPLSSALYDNLEAIASLVPVAQLDCLPDEAAAQLCREQLAQLAK